MTFLDSKFYLFLPVFFLLYYLVPKKKRYIVIAAGSLFFYGCASLKMLLLLLLSIAITYFGGLALQKKKTKGRMVLFSALNLSILLVFKYANFFIENINSAMSRIFHAQNLLPELSLILPVGLSFFIFQTCGYISDVYRKNMKAEKNLIRYIAFAAFFPTILSGPIQRSRTLLPQLSMPKEFHSDEAKKGVILFVWGLFEKLLVANNLSLIVNRIYNDLSNYNEVYYLFAAISFSLYIYADFSSYSDMARGIAKLMGIEIGKNFDNPYLSVSCGEFWNRWHQSLNNWFLENIYIPLGGNRKGILRKYCNVFVVFFVSGLWHGAHWNFIAWGVINGILVILGYIIKPYKSKLYEKIKVSEELESIQILRKIIVFGLITGTWVFFRNGTRNSLHIIKEILLLNPIHFFDEGLLSIAGAQTTTLITVLAVCFFVFIQKKRKNETESYAIFKSQPLLIQCALVAMVLYLCILGAGMGSVEVNTTFLYFQF